MVESDKTKETQEYYIKLLQQDLVNNPFYNHDLEEENWAMLGMYKDMKELLTSSKKLDKKQIPRFISGYKQAFEIIRSSSFAQRDMYTWYYKYIIGIMLTDKSKEVHSQIKKEVISNIISIVKTEEGVIRRYHLLLVLAWFSINLYAILIVVANEDTFKEKTDQEKPQKKEKSNDKPMSKKSIRKSSLSSNSRSEDLSISDGENSQELSMSYSSDSFNKVAGVMEKRLKKVFPDYDPLRVFLKIIVVVAHVFGEEYGSKVAERLKKENRLERILDGIEDYKNILKMAYEDDDGNDKNEEEDFEKREEKIKKSFGELPEIKEEDAEKAIENFVKLDLQEMIIRKSVDFSLTKTMEDIDSGSDCSNEMEDSYSNKLPPADHSSDSS
mmetsp:Transcript_18139/g.18779  ORF Transcript_18139/g.18779 Transcript_18139/m.18779 type:complete len:384 (-) Transcript_18139:61-1212(-)